MRRVLAVLLLVCAPAWMLSTVWRDPLSAGEDDVVYFEPVRVLVGESLREGRWPMANPYEATGTALMGDPQTAVLYPPTWLFAVTDWHTAYTLSILLAFVIAGVGTRLYLRRLGLTEGAALVGAFAFTFGGFMVGHRVHLAMIHTAAFLPWGLWCIEGLRRVPGRRTAFLFLVPVLFLAIASGHWPALLHMSLIWGAYLLLRARPFLPALGLVAAAGALAALLALPQLQAGFDLFAQATRQRLGYAGAGENSFFPPAAVLVLFPFLMGSRTPNLFGQRWWGPGHLCEVLGYVGLVTLVVAAATVRRAWRRKGGGADDAVAAFAPVVRTWTWIGIGAAVFMLGYYLPTYRLVHAVPVLGVVRCPARMVLAVDLALATLAAVGTHLVMRGEGPRADRLRRTLRRAVTFALPATMIGLLLLLAGAAALLPAAWEERIPWPMEGGTRDVFAALSPTNPAVLVPLALCALTIGVVRLWLGAPGRRVAAVVALLLVDLFVLTRFVDVPGGDVPPVDPEASPAARRLKPPDGDASWLVWGLADSYRDRPVELLLPKSAHALHVATIASYGPFQSPAHVHLFGMRPWGVARTWERLVRTNHLLSLYGVRYLLTADPRRRAVLEAVTVPTGPPLPDGPNLLAASWSCTDARVRDGVLRLDAVRLWPPAEARQTVALAPATRYRIALETRGPEGGAAHFLRAEVEERLAGPVDFDADPFALMAYPEQMGEDWRRFEWTFETPAHLPDAVTFRVYSMGERPIEVRDVSLRTTTPDGPRIAPGRLAPGARVYERVADLEAVRPGEAPVTVYENRLWEPTGARPRAAASPALLEELKWRPEGWLEDPGRPLPDVSLSVPAPPRTALYAGTLPALLLYVLLLAGAVRARRRAP